MSPNAANSLVHDLVEMAKAMETLPMVQAELEATRHDLNVAQDMIQTLQLRIIDYKTELENAHAATRKAEADRDIAETMFLEADERRLALTGLVKAFMHNVSELNAAAADQSPPVAVQVTEQVQAERVTEGNAGSQSGETIVPADSPETPTGQSDTTPTVPSSMIAGGTITGDPCNIDSQSISGQSEPGPTVSAPRTTDVSSETTTALFGEVASTPTAPSDPVVSVQPDPTLVTEPSSESASNASPPAQPDTSSLNFVNKPYAGMRYNDVPHYVPLDYWLAGGGTAADYYWKPAEATQ